MIYKGRCHRDLKVLFWNTHKNADINETICELVIENNASIVVLAEYAANINDLLNALQLQHKIKMQLYNSNCERIIIIGSVNNVEMRFDCDHSTIHIINEKIYYVARI